jgi:hypothetical protein
MKASDPLYPSPTQIEAAANAGRLAVLAEQLVRAKQWGSIELLFSHSSMEIVPIDEVVSAAQAVDRALAQLLLSLRDSAKVASQGESLRALAGNCLLKRLHQDPVTQKEKPFLILAAELLMAGGQPKEAAAAFERAGEEGRAAEAHGFSGDIENMERCHERLDQRRGAKRSASQLARKIESLIEGGERYVALRAMEAASPATLEAAGLINCKKNLAERLCRGRALTLRMKSGHSELIRVAGVPAIIGRQAGNELQLRDPSVSRQHASITAEEGQFAVQDAGSRSGTTVGNARLVGKVPLLNEFELGVGLSCRLRIEPLCDASSATALKLQGIAGVDRGMLAFVVHNHFELHWVIPSVFGVRIQVFGGLLRLQRLASQPVRVAGQYVGLECDLMVGDLIEISSEGNAGPVVIEVLV